MGRAGVRGVLYLELLGRRFYMYLFFVGAVGIRSVEGVLFVALLVNNLYAAISITGTRRHLPRCLRTRGCARRGLGAVLFSAIISPR